MVELSPGVGWIGGNDEAEEGIWKWAGGPENCVLGRIIVGSTPNFAFWNEGEPNNLENED